MFLFRASSSADSGAEVDEDACGCWVESDVAATMTVLTGKDGEMEISSVADSTKQRKDSKPGKIQYRQIITRTTERREPPERRGGDRDRLDRT